MNHHLTHLAAGSTGDIQRDVQHLPWWAQLLVALGLIAAGATLSRLEDQLDVSFLSVIGFAMEIAGALLAFTVLF